MANTVFMYIEDVSPDRFDASECEEFWRGFSGRCHLPDEEWLYEFLEAAVEEPAETQVS